MADIIKIKLTEKVHERPGCWSFGLDVQEAK
jgi:hypothetical protein